VISRASAECGAPGEERWHDADDYAKRSMAATRATSKACRLAFSWIMTLAGYEATPAEEIEGKAKAKVAEPRAKTEPRKASGTRKASEKQRGMIFAKLKNADISETEFASNFNPLDDLTSDQIDPAIQWIDNQGSDAPAY
jgi:hypothetical protein